VKKNKNPSTVEKSWPLGKDGSPSDRVYVVPTDRELQIDLDSKRDVKKFRKRLSFFKSQIWAYDSLKDWKLKIKTSRSISGKGYHVKITVSQRMTICERICAQVLLGDDPNRGMYNFFRYLNGSRFPVLFFERKK
jgi:hypothetical protein